MELSDFPRTDTPRILCFGEVLFDMFESNALLGGAPLNLAAHSAQLGAEPYMISRVGADDLGRDAFDQIRALGVHDDFIQSDARHLTGAVQVNVDEYGQPRYDILENTAWDYIRIDGDGAEDIATFDFHVFCFGSLAQRSEVNRLSLLELYNSLRNCIFFYDANLRQEYYSKRVIENSFKLCHILKLNEEEVNIISDVLYRKKMPHRDFCRRTAEEFAIPLIIITRGDKGCYIFAEGKLRRVPGHNTRVLDTVGAGDAFSAAFLVFLFRGDTPREAGRKANRLGAYVASKRGAIPRYSQRFRREIGLPAKPKTKKAAS